MRRVWLRGPGRRARNGRGLSGGAVQLMLSAVLGIGLALALIRAFDGSVRPTVTEMARTQVSNAVTRIVDTAVTDTLAPDGQRRAHHRIDQQLHRDEPPAHRYYERYRLAG